MRQARVGEALALQAVHQVVVDITEAERLDPLLVLDQIFDLHQEPGIDSRQLEDLFHGHAGTERITDVPDAICARHGQFTSDRGHGVAGVKLNARIETASANLQAAQSLMQRFLEGPADSHDLAYRLHLGSQTGVGIGEFLEGKTRNLGHHVVDRRLE